MIDLLREGAAVVYVEGIYDPSNTAPTLAWTADNPALRGGIATSRVSGSHRVTVSTLCSSTRQCTPT